VVGTGDVSKTASAKLQNDRCNWIKNPDIHEDSIYIHFATRVIAEFDVRKLKNQEQGLHSKSTFHHH
jgi:hypothetical protein